MQTKLSSFCFYCARVYIDTLLYLKAVNRKLFTIGDLLNQSKLSLNKRKFSELIKPEDFPALKQIINRINIIARQFAIATNPN